MTVAVGEVQQSIGHSGRRAVRSDVVHANGNKGHGPVGRKLQGRHRGTEDFHPFLEGLRVERQRTTVVTTLVRRRFSRRAKAAPFAGTKPRSLRGAKIESGFDSRYARQLALIEPITFKSDARRGPF